MSGAANCPETPRQKMIGMMYLVLTAMLALNVSADILNGFTLVNKSISQSIVATTERNRIVYSELQVMKEINPAKVGPWLEEALEVKAKADSIFDYLQCFKENINKLVCFQRKITICSTSEQSLKELFSAWGEKDLKGNQIYSTCP